MPMACLAFVNIITYHIMGLHKYTDKNHCWVLSGYKYEHHLYFRTNREAGKKEQ